MSRIGRKPIPVPDGVEVKIDGNRVTVKGKHGELSLQHHPNMTVVYDEQAREIRVSRPDDQRQNRALHGLTRALINNMVQGVHQPFEKRLEIVGVGYQAFLNGKELELQVGFAHSVKLTVPDNVQCELPDTTHIVLRSPDKQAVGQFAAEIRRVRPPEPYKGKGIRYQGEHIRRKAGKAFAGGAG
ncbi:MAG: 50S ribosomal protein L6 [Planctomycetes bacterium]|nr:50S ribosomal protein L6 [Planctomycetota bacterium]